MDKIKVFGELINLYQTVFGRDMVQSVLLQTPALKLGSNGELKSVEGEAEVVFKDLQAKFGELSPEAVAQIAGYIASGEKRGTGVKYNFSNETISFVKETNSST